MAQFYLLVDNQVQTRCAAVGSHYLIRARKNLKARVIERLVNGSTLLDDWKMPDQRPLVRPRL